MDDIAAFRCAIRFGFGPSLRKPADVTDAMLAAMALENDRESAREILRECGRRLSVPDVPHENQDLIVRFFCDFEYARRITNDVDDDSGRYIIAQSEALVTEHSAKLGEAFTTYLKACFRTARDMHEHFIIDPEGDCPEVPDWLGQAFNITPFKGDGQPIDAERDADILDGMKFIVEALQQKSEHYATGLEEVVSKFEPGDDSELPFCIERLIKLKGYPTAEVCLLPITRIQLAQFILDEIERLRSIKITHWRIMAGANIFIKCQDACIEQVEALLQRPDTSDADRIRLRERRETLRQYGSESLQKHNKSGNASGIARLYRNHQRKIHGQIKRSATTYQPDEAEALLAEIEADKAGRVARNHPAVQEAFRIINSPDVGNHSRKRLRKLQKQTPSEYQFIWPELWTAFTEALHRVAARIRNGHQ